MEFGHFWHNSSEMAKPIKKSLRVNNYTGNIQISYSHLNVGISFHIINKQKFIKEKWK